MNELQLRKDKNDIINFEQIQIELNRIKYDLNIKVKENKIVFSIYEQEQFPAVNYERTMDLKEIKDLNIALSGIYSFNDFYDYLKSLSNNKKINIKKNNDKISLILFIEDKSSQQEIEIDLYPEKKDLYLNIKDVYKQLLNIQKNIDDLKNENKQMIKEINILKNENKELKNKIEEKNKEVNESKEVINIDTSLLNGEYEKRMICSEIEIKMNKKIKRINKLYQATIDGANPKNFHLKCDYIPNTLVLIKSKGQRRFGGFTPISWKPENGIYIKDTEMKTFVFSLDNKKIYDIKDVDYAVHHYFNYGPYFGNGDICIKGNPIQETKLSTNQMSYDYKGDKSALSESSFNIKALEYEVFQVLFE